MPDRPSSSGAKLPRSQCARNGAIGLDGSEHGATLTQVGAMSHVSDAFEVALLVENGPRDARELVSKRDRQHVAVQPLLGGFDPKLELVALPVLRSDQPGIVRVVDY
jgi:hypothetical protein